ncbi:MAG: Fe2+ transport system protein B FeoB [Candidatus Methanohalarchaeum thermophilum]|uniref:Fe2+ transport system protein B FeoB n=1 Tax=Methanohalarchaeum thermophilum TaxID=1903181 RepID=A0A1Q6DTQ4_METT1|nr:MAG: Fe2+ transport system protein B FeoB [Candidatus Methanohalarchaeum thermophilum]
MKRILLVGNPNVGKSVFFSRLTGAKVITSNYPGTTIDYKKGYAKIDEEEYEIVDVPGTYSLSPDSKAEKIASDFVEEGDIVINVLDATNLERNLYLTLELLEKDIPVIVALNMWDETKHRGISIDLDALEEDLEVPVVPTVALTGEGFKELTSKISELETVEFEEHTSDEKWAKIGEIIEDVQEIEDKEHTIRERISEATIRPLTGIPIALGVLYLTFRLIRFIGEWLIGNVTEPFFHEIYSPLILGLADLMGRGFLFDILIGSLIDGKIAFMESMGLLTTGIFVPFGAVLPYILSFYFTLSLLEDSGYLPRLGTLLDNVFHKLGMHGYGIIPVFLGLGCNVPGALATRTLESEKQRFISSTLLAISIPCMAQTAMIFGVLGPFGMQYIFIVFITLALLYLVMGLILNNLTEGESPEIFLEIPPYRKPDLVTVLKKTYMRVKWFIKEAVPYLFLGIVLVNLAYFLGFLDFISGITAPIIVNLFGLPKEAVSALVVGFLRKDLAMGMLLGLGMSPMQLVIASTMLTIYFPCAATFATLLKELGIRDLLKSTVIMIVTVFVIGTLMRLILI